MTEIKLIRYNCNDRRSLGRWTFPGGRILWTLERPFIADEVSGSRPYESCVPEGVYELVPHESEKHGQTWALVNHDLKVFHYQQPDGIGRFACLIHAGNTVNDIVGCIAPGLNRSGDAVLKSRKAMALVRSVLDPMSTGHRLIITNGDI